MTMTPSTQREPFHVHLLHPKMIEPIGNLRTALTAQMWTSLGVRYRFEPFEGNRSPARQYDLFARGKVTKARPWESAHQYGLAVDFAARVVQDDGTMGDWSWNADFPWEQLKREARRHGLDVPISWDRGHVEHPLFKRLRTVMA